MLKYMTYPCLFFLGFLIHTTCQAELVSRAKIYELGSERKNLLYTFAQDREEKDGIRTLKTVYSLPNSADSVIDETSQYKIEDSRLIRFEQSHKQLGSVGSVEVKGSQIHFKYTKDGKTKEATEELTDNFVVSPSIVPYLRSKWADLKGGKTVEVRLGVLDRQETVRFDFFKTKETTFDGKKATVLKMKPSSFFIAALVNPLHFTFSEDGRDLLSIEGRVAPKRKEGGSLKDLDAETVYEHISAENSK